MAKKVVATLKTGTGKNFTKCIKTSHSAIPIQKRRSIFGLRFCIAPVLLREHSAPLGKVYSGSCRYISSVRIFSHLLFLIKYLPVDSVIFIATTAVPFTMLSGSRQPEF